MRTKEGGGGRGPTTRGGEEAAEARQEKRGGDMGKDGASGEENEVEWAQGWRLGF